MSDQYTVTIPVKPYNKQFLVLNYGDPANLAKNPRLNNLFRRCLKKPCARYDNTHIQTISKRLYTQTIDIIITENDFYRYGWELTRTDTIAFNREIEELTKFFMRNTVAIYENLMPQKDAILRFQNQFGFHEDIWTYEAIKKDYFRNCTPHRVKIFPDIIQKIEEFFMLNLSNIETFSNLKPIHHENNSKEPRHHPWYSVSVCHTYKFYHKHNQRKHPVFRTSGPNNLRIRKSH